MEVSKFTDKLNKASSRNYVIEEEIEVTGGVYEAELIHDNINKKTVNVYTGSKLTGTKIDAFALSIPSLTLWRTIIKIFTDASPVYVSYETPGDTVEADDINSVQDAIVYTQEETNREVDRLDKAIEAETDRAKTEEKIIADNLTAETKRAKDAEKVLTDNLSAEVVRAEKAEQFITNNLNAEITRAKEAEKVLDDKVSDETARAKTAEKALTDNLSSEVARATGAEAGITNNLNSEIDRSKAAEQTIANNLSAEVTRAKGEEQSINSKLDAETLRAKGAEQQLTNDLNSEVSRSKNAEAALVNDLSAETVRAKSAETALTNNLNAEITRAKNEEAAIKNDLSRVEAVAKGASKGLTFDTQVQLMNWLAGTYVRTDGKTKADLQIADNLYIKELDVPDYWWDGITIQILETQKVDLTDYAKTTEVKSSIVAHAGLSTHITEGERTSWNNKVDKTGDASNTINSFTQATTRANLSTGEKISISLGKIMKWFADLGSLAFKSSVAKTDLDTSLQTEITNKVDKVSGKQLSTEDYTLNEKNKLAGIEAGANKYTHPANHPASIITQDGNNRLVTDAQIANWNTAKSIADSALPPSGGTLSGMIYFTNNAGGIQGTMGVNDFYRIIGRSTADNAGYVEIATADDGNEPIYIRQYTGSFATLIRTLILLDSSGNSVFPGTITATRFIGPLQGNADTATKLKSGATWNDLKGV